MLMPEDMVMIWEELGRCLVWVKATCLLLPRELLFSVVL